MPPVRDEESETQRKAHAKRVRETRRSTQGVTLDEIKSAEQLVKQKNHNNNSIGNHAEVNIEEHLLIDSVLGDIDRADGSFIDKMVESNLFGEEMIIKNDSVLDNSFENGICDDKSNLDKLLDSSDTKFITQNNNTVNTLTSSDCIDTSFKPLPVLEQVSDNNFLTTSNNSIQDKFDTNIVLYNKNSLNLFTRLRTLLNYNFYNNFLDAFNVRLMLEEAVQYMIGLFFTKVQFLYK